MTKDIKFSVTIPAYKDRYLKETIDSVLAQTNQNYEIVIVNDASPYNLGNIVHQYTAPRIHYFKLELYPKHESVYSLIYIPSNTHLGVYKLPYGWQSDDISTFIAATYYIITNNQESRFQYRANGLYFSHDLTSIKDKIESVRASVKWRLSLTKKSRNIANSCYETGYNTRFRRMPPS